MEFAGLLETRCIADAGNTAGHLFSLLCVDAGDVERARNRYCTGSE